MKRLFHIGLWTAVIMVVCLSVWGIWIQSGPLLSVTVLAPAQVNMGESFQMRVDLDNPNAEAAVLDSIDVDASLLQGFDVVSVTPGPVESYEVPLLDQRTWEFTLKVDPGGRSTVLFELRGARVGVFSGRVDVCNPYQGFTESMVEIEVSDP